MKTEGKRQGDRPNYRPTHRPTRSPQNTRHFAFVFAPGHLGRDESVKALKRAPEFLGWTTIEIFVFSCGKSKTGMAGGQYPII